MSTAMRSSEARKLYVPDFRDDIEASGQDEEYEDNIVQADFEDFSG